MTVRLLFFLCLLWAGFDFLWVSGFGYSWQQRTHIMCFLLTLCRRQQIVDFRWQFFFFFTFRSSDFQKLNTSFVFRSFLMGTHFRNEARFVVGGRGYCSLLIAAFWSLLRKRFVGNCTIFPSAPARVDCLTRPDFPVGRYCYCLTFYDVSFLFTRFGDGSMFSDVDDSETLDIIDVVLTDFRTSDRNFRPLVGVRGTCFPSVLFTVAFLLVGLLCSSFRVSVTVSLDVSSRKKGCHGAFGFSVSKKRKQCPAIRADLYAT